MEAIPQTSTADRKPIKCLRNQRKTIPKKGIVNLAKITAKRGYCEPCNLQSETLRQHFIEGHCHISTGHPPMGPVGLINVDQYPAKPKASRRKRGTVDKIPEDENIKVDPRILKSRGRCERKGCKKKIQNLVFHFVAFHTGLATLVSVIPVEWWTVDTDLITYGSGKCLVPGCKTQQKQLYIHFKRKHMKETVICQECNKEVLKLDLRSHRLFHHTQPQKCSKCGAQCATVGAVVVHIRTQCPGATQVPLSADELKDYLNAKERARIKSQKLDVKKGEHFPRLVEFLETYARRLRDPTDIVHQLAQTLKEMFFNLFDPYEDPILAFHSSYVSWFHISWKIPFLVFEVLKKADTTKKLQRPSGNCADPMVGKLVQPQQTDYAGNGYDKGHMAAAANYADDFLIAPTFYYSNLVPMSPALNRGPSKTLENLVRSEADAHNSALVFRFPVMNNQPRYLGKNRIRVPDAIATVLIVEKHDGKSISAWELRQSEDVYPLGDCQRNPFDLMDQAGIPFTLRPDDFVFITQDSRI